MLGGSYPLLQVVSGSPHNEISKILNWFHKEGKLNKNAIDDGGNIEKQ